MKLFDEGYIYDREHDFEFRGGDSYIYAWETKSDEKNPEFLFVTKNRISAGFCKPTSTATLTEDFSQGIWHVKEQTRYVKVSHDDERRRPQDFIVLKEKHAKTFINAYETWKAHSILLGAIS